MITFFEKQLFLFIRQKKELTEILIDWETKNRYEILDENKNPIGTILEKNNGVIAFIKRLILRSHRPMDVEVSAEGRLLLNLSRNFFFFFSDLLVKDSSHQFIGSIHRRFAFFTKKYDLRDERGHLFATISSPFWRLWSFPVVNNHNREIALISKKWGGILAEAFTDADQFGVQYIDTSLCASQKAIIFSAAISIDFDYFENNSKSGGLFGS